MLTTENSRSPLRILEQSSHGAVRPGDLGVVMARAGVGKTAFLVQVGIDHALREKPTLHIAFGEDLDHVRSWYDALFSDLAATALSAEEVAEARERFNRYHLIHASPRAALDPARLAETLKLYESGLGFVPRAILVEGYEWTGRPASELTNEITLLKELAATVNAELWMTAQTQRAVTTEHPTGVTPPCDGCAELIDLAIFLEPEGSEVSVRLLKDHGEKPSETHLVLHPDTMQIARDDESDARVALPTHAFTLISGSAKGAEQAFGEAAEHWGLAEINFTFAGREPKRSRGLEILDEEALERGSVSPAYIATQLHRSFPTTETFQRIFKMIWHQIATAGEVFAIGNIQDDGTVRGGTGWGVELARHFHKRLYVFDQSEERWFEWRDDAWQESDTPQIRRTRFAGTGTRFPTEAALRAIAELFERSFGSDEG
jgi:hypothetical protein